MKDNLRNVTLRLLRNTDAVVELPMRLTVAIIIGAVVLAALVSYIMNPCLMPGKLMVSITPLLHEIPTGQNSTDITVFIKVTNTQGRPVSDAQVRIHGLHGISSNTTTTRGETTCNLTVTLEQGVYEGYVDVFVKAPCFEPFTHTAMIKVVREQ